MSTGIPHNNGNQPITNDSHGRQQTTFRMPLTLPENKRLKLQQHQLKQQQHTTPQGMDQSGQKPLHSPVPPISGYTQQHQQNPLQHQQQQTQQPQQYFTNPTYQQASVSRPAFDQSSSSYVHHGSAQPPNTQHGQIQGRSQVNPYQYVPLQQPSQQYQPASTSSGANNGMQQGYMNTNTAPSGSTTSGNSNYQMYNLSGLPPSARPTTGSGQQAGAMNSQSTNTGPLSTHGQPLAVHGDELRTDASGSGGPRRMDNHGYNDYSLQVPNSASTSNTNQKASSIAVPGSSKASGSGMPTDMPAFTGGSFAMSSSAPSGGAGTLSGYQVGMSSSNSIAQSMGQIGQQVQMQQDSSKGPFGGSMGLGQSSGAADQEIFEVCLESKSGAMASR